MQLKEYDEMVSKIAKFNDLRDEHLDLTTTIADIKQADCLYINSNKFKGNIQDILQKAILTAIDIRLAELEQEKEEL